MATQDGSSDMMAMVMDGLKNMVPFLPMYLHLVVSALFPIYAGAYASLSRPSSAAPPAKAAKKDDSTKAQDDNDYDEDEPIQKMEGLNPQDAIVFPVTAGLVLAGLYYLIKTYGAELINSFLGWYFAVVGVYSVTQFVNDALTFVWGFVLPDYYLDHGKLWSVSTENRATVNILDKMQTRSSPLPGVLGRIRLPQMAANVLWRQRDALKNKFVVKGHAKSIVEFELLLTRHNIFSALAGTAIVVYANFIRQSWYLTNLQGFAVSYGALQLMSPTSFSTGSLILSALFAYDIWAVFFTPLMVTVAKNLDVPIKLIFPRPGEDRAFSMLGLGDIVIPGIMIAMALRFDLYLFYLKKQKKCEGDVPKSDADSKTAELEVLKAPYIPATGSWGTKFLTRGADPATLPARLTSTFPKVYFTASLIGYTTGLVVTLMAMSISEHPQPALLYLVPGVLSSLWLTSLVRGEATAMWEFSEGLDEDEAEKALAAAKKQTEQPNPADAKDQTTWSWFTREVASFFGSTTTEETTPAAIAAAKQKPYTSTKASSKDDVILSFSVTRAATRPNMPVSTSAGQVAPSQTPEE